LRQFLFHLPGPTLVLSLAPCAVTVPPYLPSRLLAARPRLEYYGVFSEPIFLSPPCPLVPFNFRPPSKFRDFSELDFAVIVCLWIFPSIVFRPDYDIPKPCLLAEPRALELFFFRLTFPVFFFSPYEICTLASEPVWSARTVLLSLFLRISPSNPPIRCLDRFPESLFEAVSCVI